MSNTKTIAKNAAWNSVENIVNVFVTLITSVAIARTLGPSKTGYIIYVSYVASVVANLGGLGISAATRKYMAEFIGKGQRGVARFIFVRTLTLQVGLASLATCAILLWVIHDANAQFRLAAFLIALSIWPSMVNAIPSQANVASEDLASNVPASIISGVTYVFAILASVVFHWGVTGIGAALLLMRCVDFLIRLFPVVSRVLAWESSLEIPDGLRSRMIAYAWKSILTMLLTLVVWQRSEVLLLRHLCSDIQQVAFYSIAFSMGNYLLLSATIFGTSASTTIFAQFGRDKSKLGQLAASSFRYLTLTSIPLHFVFTALAVPALILFYSSQYKAAAMVVTIAPILCMPKAFLAPVQSLLQSSESQSSVIFATLLAGIVDVSVAWLLIPAHGAVGACIGNGVAQVTALGIMWAIAVRRFRIRIPWLLTAKVTLASTIAALCAHLIVRVLPPILGLVAGGLASLIVLQVLFYFLRVLEPQDRDRFATVAAMLPRRAASMINKLLSVLIRPVRVDDRAERQIAERVFTDVG